MLHVVHISSVHPAFDNRIFYKELKTLESNGFVVTFIVPHESDVIVDNIRILAVDKPFNRLDRVTRTMSKIFKKALEVNGDIYHFHDPELIPIGLFLRARGKKVIYDIHENYLLSLETREYIPTGLRRFVSKSLAFLEKVSAKYLEIILAERSYAKRFPEGIQVLNYPKRTFLKNNSSYSLGNSTKHKLLFTGIVTEDRGALTHAQIVELIDNVEVHVVGRCDKKLASKMREIAGKGVERLFITGENGHVPYNEILKYYSEGNWLAGLALFPPIPKNMEKELTKLFEYMQAGIPICCSNFPIWKNLIDDTKSGIYVDPDDSVSIVNGIQYLIKNAEKRVIMGEKGKLAVEEKYNWDVESKKLLGVYNNLYKV